MAKSGLVEVGETSKLASMKRNRGIAIFDLVLRIFAVVGTLGSASAMGTSDETLPFNTQFFVFQAQYDDFTAFKLFVIANAIVCGYLALSFPLSISHIIRSHAGKSRVLLIFLDLVMVAFLTGGASAAAAIVYLAHNGNTSANWFGICQQYGDFCQRTSGSLIGSFGAIVAILLVIILSNVALSRR